MLSSLITLVPSAEEASFGWAPLPGPAAAGKAGKINFPLVFVFAGQCDFHGCTLTGESICLEWELDRWRDFELEKRQLVQTR